MANPTEIPEAIEAQLRQLESALNSQSEELAEAKTREAALNRELKVTKEKADKAQTDRLL